MTKSFENSCLTCVAATDDDHMNGYLDIICNLTRGKNKGLTPYEQRRKLIKGYTNSDVIEAQLPCPFHCTVDQYIELMRGKLND